MREILFRGKRILGKQEWTYGVPFIDHEGDCIFKTRATEFIVDGKTVGQYTGLTDKNGKKIFEGDIIKADNWLHQNMKIYTIVFEDGGFYAKHKDEDCWNFDHLENIEIIGNIHDNPELLKGE